MAAVVSSTSPASSTNWAPHFNADIPKWPMTATNYDAHLAYAMSKGCSILFTLELRRRLQGTNVLAVSGHPGIVSTELTRYNTTYWMSLECIMPFTERLTGQRFMKSIPEGAATTMCMVFHDLPYKQTGDLTDRLYLSDGVDALQYPGRMYPDLVCNAAKAAELWTRSEEIIKGLHL